MNDQIGYEVHPFMLLYDCMQDEITKIVLKEKIVKKKIELWKVQVWEKTHACLWQTYARMW